MATSEWLREMRQAAEAAHGTTPTAAISRPRDATDAPIAPPRATEAAPRAGTAQTGPQGTPQRTQRAFTAPTDAARDYRAMYRKAFEYHKRHNPPTVDIEYWKSHSPGIDEAPPVELDYWEKAIEDMAATADSIQQDPFLTNLLVAIFEELEKEDKALRDGATAG